MVAKETIVALATPQGIGALAIIRISGKETFKIVEKIIQEKEKYNKLKEKKIGLFTIKNKKKDTVIDETMIIKYKSPKSFTGEDIVEIIAHGGMYTVKNIVKEIIKNGARIADRGEFTKRAFLNGKINLIKAEAIKKIIESQNEEQYKKGIASYLDQGEKIREWKNKIEKELTYIEAEIEFGEEEKIESRKEKEIKKIEKEIKEEILRSKIIRNENKGIDIVICGPSNAGKSTLFNFIIGSKRAITNEKKGTTRDIIREKINIDDKEINIIDTAGIRISECEIEKEGIKRTKELIKENNIKIWITDISENIDKEEKEWIKKIEGKNTIIIINKIEKEKNAEKEKFYKEIKEEKIYISLKEKENTEKILKKIKQKIERKKDNGSIEIFTNERQIKIAEKSLKLIRETIKNWEQKEIASYFLRETISAFEEIFGKNEDEKIINNIFEKFCIGK